MYLPGYYEYDCRVNVISGPGALEKIPRLLAGLNAESPMIVTDAGVVKAGVLDTVTAALADRVSLSAVEDGVPPDSDVHIVNRLAGVYRERRCDSLIAVGGGSVMDTAKGINIVVSEGVDDLRQLAGAGALTRPLKPLIAVPTTAGTGSEVTLVAVVADPEEKRKMIFTSYFLQPDAAVIDPLMTLTLNAQKTLTAEAAKPAQPEVVKATETALGIQTAEEVDTPVTPVHA